MKVLLLEVPSDAHAFKGWVGGTVIQKILGLLNIECVYKLILSKKYLLKSLKDISDYDIVHLECHSDNMGICYNPKSMRSLSWNEFAIKLAENNNLGGKFIIISGCLAGSINSEAKLLAQKSIGFKRVFAFVEKIDFDKAIAVWSSFYYLMSISDEWTVKTTRQSVKKLRDCFKVNLIYFYLSNRKGVGVNVFPKYDS
jgi:hypothetical protein